MNCSDRLCGHHHRLGLLVLGGDLLLVRGSRDLLRGKLLGGSLLERDRLLQGTLLLLGHERLLQGSLLLLEHERGLLLLCRRIIRAKHAPEK